MKYQTALLSKSVNLPLVLTITLLLGACSQQDESQESRGNRCRGTQRCCQSGWFQHCLPDQRGGRRGIPGRSAPGKGYCRRFRDWWRFQEVPGAGDRHQRCFPLNQGLGNRTGS